jgi:hypothetical protein
MEKERIQHVLKELEEKQLQSLHHVKRVGGMKVVRRGVELKCKGKKKRPVSSFRTR